MEKKIFYQNYLANLNDQQKEAAQTVEGPTLLLAVPGSGKTTVLVARLGYMVHCCDISPESILTLTYTVATTKEMKQRFAIKFGQEYADRMNFWTINGLSARIINFYGRNYAKRPSFELLDNEGRVVKILSDIYKRITRQYPAEATIKSLRTAITFVKNMMLSDQEIQKMNVDVDKFPVIFREYENYLKNMRLMDFDDQMVYAFRILQLAPPVLGHFQNQFQYICVDESQDTSKIQHEIIALLAKKGQNIFMVGDEDQSIYGFRAAYPEALINFEKMYPNAKVLLMEKNYRSVQEIVDVANAFVKRNRFRHEKIIEATRGNGTQVQVLNVGNRAEQISQLVGAARNCDKETAVLYRNNESVIPLIDILDRQNIPFNIRAADAVFFTHRIVSDISDIIRFAYNPTDCGIFERIYYKLGCYLSKAAAGNACERSKRSGKAVLEILSLSNEVNQQARRKLHEIQIHLGFILKETSAENVLSTIWNKIGYKEYVVKNHFDPSKYEILRMIGKNEKDGQGLLRRLGELADIMRYHENSRSTKFILSTIHSSKGLEYDTVYLLDVIDKVFPSIPFDEIQGESDMDNIRLYEEERRLFYVGMTRAKNELYLFSVKKRDQSFVDEVQCAIRREEYQPVRMEEDPVLPPPLPPLPKSAYTESMRGFTRRETPKIPTDAAGYVPGAAVVHRVYGAGKIEKINDNQITIIFENAPKKTFDFKVSLSKKLIRLQ